MVVRVSGAFTQCKDRKKIEAIKARHPRWEYIQFEYGRWTSSHENYDASWEGEEDGWVSNGLIAEGRTLDDLEEDMRLIEEERSLTA